MGRQLHSGRDVEIHLQDGNLQVVGPRADIVLTPTDVNALLEAPTEDGTEVTLNNGWAVVTNHPWCDIHVDSSQYILTRIDVIEAALSKLQE